MNQPAEPLPTMGEDRPRAADPVWDVLVVGELNVDIVFAGLTAFPSLGKEVISKEMRVVLGSSSAICAAGLAKLGARVTFVGNVGDDVYGHFVLSELNRLGVDTEAVRLYPHVPTGVTVSLVHAKERALITYPGSIATLHAHEVPISRLRQVQHVHVSSYYLQQALQPGLPGLLGQALRWGLSTSLDVGFDPTENWQRDEVLALLAYVDVFLPNELEARALTQLEDVVAAAEYLADHVRDVVVIKRGANGALAVTRHGQHVEVPAFSVPVVDTTGAGDSFNAGFIYAYLLEGRSLAESLRFAAACGALATTALGGTASQPTYNQVQDFLRAVLSST